MVYQFLEGVSFLPAPRQTFDARHFEAKDFASGMSPGVRQAGAGEEAVQETKGKLVPGRSGRGRCKEKLRGLGSRQEMPLWEK